MGHYWSEMRPLTHAEQEAYWREKAEGKLKKIAEYLDERDAAVREMLGFPDTVEVVAKVTTNDIRQLL